MKKKIAGFKKDKLSISTNPFVSLNFNSSLFDDDGVLSKKIDLIKNGIFTNYFSNKQYADYLGIKPTGAFGCIDIKSGKKFIKEISKQIPYIEIVSFSSFVPNSISGDFSAEIRLGYLVTKDKKSKSGKIIKKPFKGGMFSGNVFEIIQDMSLSKERKEETGYIGPKIVLFNNCVVSGMD